jgi:3-deoxy-manno-octulosonate cytidylyltransferase (CMP-KDO synthetase)
MSLCAIPEEIINPACVKVIFDKKYDAIYFSRSIIPFNRDHVRNLPYYKHFGVYAYRPEMLKTFVSLPPGNLEQIERLEQLRLLENGYKIRMVMTEYAGIGIDTPEDIILAESILAKKA